MDICHRTNIKRLYAVGECASIYHGANRLGGNSLLAAIHSGMTAAESISGEAFAASNCNFSSYISEQESLMNKIFDSESKFPAVNIRQDIIKIINSDLGITRTGVKLRSGIESMDYYLSICDKLNFDCEISPYQSYSLEGMITLARAVLTCAEARKESRGAHIREDYPERSENLCCSTLISYNRRHL